MATLLDVIVSIVMFVAAAPPPASSPTACPDVTPSAWRAPTKPADILPAVFRRAAPKATPGACAVPICHARVSGSSGGFLASDIPDVIIRLDWNGTNVVGRGEDDAREAWVMVAHGPIGPAVRWRAIVLDDDGPGRDDELGRQEGVMSDGTLAWTTDTVKFACRFLTSADHAALVRDLRKAIDTDAAALARRPNSPQRPTLERLLERFDTLVSVSTPQSPAVTEARDVIRNALLAWVPSGTKATVANTATTLTLGPGFSVIVETAANAKTPIVFSHMRDPYGFDSFGIWIDLDSPELAHGSATSSFIGEISAAPGARATIPFTAIGSKNDTLGRPLLVSGWKKGFFGTPQFFALRH